MGLIMFLILCLSLAGTSSFAKEITVNQTRIQLDVFHVHGHGSSLRPNSTSSFAYVLSHDENRAMSLVHRISRKGTDVAASVSTSRSVNLLEPNLARIGLNPGLSIGSGNYYVKLGFGSPPKYYAMIVDTGSSLSWLQCKPCAIYCHPQVDTLFDPSTSKTYKTLPCRGTECSSLKAATLNDPLCEVGSGSCVYTASYGDTSYSIGYLSQDLLSLAPSVSLPNFIYGCGQDNEGLFGRAAGIVGLDRDKLSLLTQLSPRYSSAFSYCLPTATSTTPTGGFLSVGQISPAPYKFTPMLSDAKNPSLYFLRLAAITIAGKPLSLSAAEYKVPTVIDSGTVITRLPTSMYAALRYSFTKIMSTKYAKAPAYSILDTCFKGSLKSLAATPGVQLIFQGGAGLSLRASNILLEVEKGTTCLAFTAISGNSPIAIIGNHQQQTYSIAYDVAHSRIGFAPGGCH